MAALTTVVFEPPWPWWAPDLFVTGFVAVLSLVLARPFITGIPVARSILFMMGMAIAANVGWLTYSWEGLVASIPFVVADTYVIRLWRWRAR